MARIRTMTAALVLGALATAGAAQANDWGRFYHYPYSPYPVQYRQPFRSADFNGQYGYPAYPQYMAFPPYYRKDLYYDYLKFRKPGNNPKLRYQGNHFILDVF
jgi:hypothetical protein